MYTLHAAGIASAFAAVLALAFLVGGVALLLTRAGSLWRTAIGLAGVTVGGALFLFSGASAVLLSPDIVWLRNGLVFLAVGALLHVVVNFGSRVGAWTGIAAAGLAFMLAPGSAYAGDGTAVNLAPLMDALVAAAAGSVPVLVALVHSYLKRRHGLELDAHTRGYVQDAAERCADLLAASLKRQADAGRLSVDVHNAAVATVANTLMQQVPDGLRRLGINQAGVERMLSTRLAARGLLPPEDGARLPAGA